MTRRRWISWWRFLESAPYLWGERSILSAKHIVSDMKYLHMIAFILLIVGGLNWLLVAFNYNLVDMIFGAGSTLSMLIYILVGLSAIYLVATHKKDCRVCASGGMM